MENKTISFGGKQVVLYGTQVRVGDKAPDFTLLDNTLKPVKLSDLQGKVKLISVFPSIDTSVCSLQNHRFNKEASSFGDKVAFLAVSVDLPFALKRFCGAEGISNLLTLSDHRETEFGKKYGFLISDLRLLARGVIIIDKENIVKYVEIVEVASNEPNYEAALQILKKL